MFYNAQYLRKNGRFGLVWIAATHSRVLSRREMCAVNISATVSDILEHVPGQIGPNVYNRPRRFSLYLSSQLMFGSAKILQKQWDFLLSDLTILMRKFYPEVSLNEIDLIVTRSDPVTLDSGVPTSAKDKCYDPFFGILKEYHADIEDLLVKWDEEHVKKEPVELQEVAQFRPVLGSPHSVSDERQIQIQDQVNTSISSLLMAPGGQELPCLDAENLALLQSADENVQLFVEEPAVDGRTQIPDEQRDVSAANAPGVSHIADELASHVRPAEETPAAKTAQEQPSTPQKPKRKRHDEDDGRKRKRVLDKEGNVADQLDETARNEAHQEAVSGVVHNVPSHQVGETSAVQEAEPQSIIEEPQLLSPEGMPKSQHDWLEKNPKLQLTPIQPSPSPVRKRRPHKLIIDDILQMTRVELKQNMTHSSETSTPLALPSTLNEDFFNLPGSRAIRGPLFRKLWVRNCKFGIRVYETDIELSSLNSSLDSPLPKLKRRKEHVEDYQTPAKQSRTDLVQSGQNSVEQARGASVLSASNISRERSKSFVGDDSTSSISGIQQVSPHPDLERSVGDTVLAALPEEQEHMDKSAMEIPADMQPEIVSPKDQTAPQDNSINVDGDIMSLVHSSISHLDDWTTFRSICPPRSTYRHLATRLFHELCNQVAIGCLRVRQDEPYGEIYIWYTEEESGTVEGDHQ